MRWRSPSKLRSEQHRSGRPAENRTKGQAVERPVRLAGAIVRAVRVWVAASGATGHLPLPANSSRSRAAAFEQRIHLPALLPWVESASRSSTPRDRTGDHSAATTTG
jgi:hypothetical protein